MNEKSTRDKFIIVDGYSLAFRAFFATQLLTTSDGRPTNALFGLANMLLSLLERERPYGIVVVFDAPGKTFRHAEFPEYKAQRKETDPALKEQLPLARDLVNALGIPSVEVVGYEADDVAGTLARKVAEKGLKVLIVTGDNDQLQLVDENTTVRMTMRGISDVVDFSPEVVRNRYGFGPERIPDYKALRGDPSDNIPGVPGIGDKTATLLIQQYGSAEEVLRHLDELPPKFRSKLEANPEIVRLGKRLTSIVTDVPLDFHPQPYRLTPADLKRAKEFFDSLEFRTLKNRLEPVLSTYVEGSERADTVEVRGIEVERHSATSEAIHALKKLPEIGFAVVDQTIALSDGERAWLIKDDVANYLNLLIDRIAPSLRVHGARSALAEFKKHGIPRPSVGFDAELAAYVLSPGRGSYPLDASSREFLEVDPGPDPAATAAAVFALKDPMLERLASENTLRVYEEVELPLIPVLLDMEEAGIAVDRDHLNSLSKTLEARMRELELRIYSLAGREFNIGSTKQLSKVLFEDLGLTTGRKTKTGYSTDAEVLGALAVEHEIAARILEWREVSKLKSTYADALPKLIAEDGRIHTTFLQTGTATGRLSSVDPNLQNIPIKTDLGREIRRGFVAPQGMQLLSLDYSQIELRLLAHMCEDPSLIAAFERGLDIHAATASSLFGTPQEEVSPEQRRVAKMVNYAVLYGMSDFGLAQSLGVGVGDAHKVIADYFIQFPAVKRFTEEIVEQARSKGYTQTLMGRKRYFPEIRSGNRQVRLAAERAAVNAPIQGSAADMIKIAMIDIYRSVPSSDAKLLLQVHDELLFECPAEGLGVAGQLARIMERAMQLKVPVVVDRKTGPNWRDMN